MAKAQSDSLNLTPERRGVSEHVIEVRQGFESTGTSSESVLPASSELAANAEKLREQADGFLAHIRKGASF